MRRAIPLRHCDTDRSAPFGVADHVTVRSAGLLSIDLVRKISEAMRPRKICLSGGDAHTIEPERKKTDAPKRKTADA